ncbi:MAG TPA: AAA family ATPase [Fibrobacteria bacterium]|nr:AAA family ATPase [Fibrobacteria bacterium]
MELHYEGADSGSPEPVGDFDAQGGESAYVLRDALPSSGRTLIRRGIRKSDGQAVILKTLPLDHLPHHADRLKKEYEIGKRLGLDSVVKSLDMVSIQGIPTLVTEDFGAVSLHHHLAGKPLEPEAFLNLALPITAAVAGLHQRNVVHRDLKPENILVNPASGEIKLCDLGLASQLPCPRPTGKSSRTIEGSLPYMSPEQTGRMNRDLDHRSDLYALGVVFFEMLTGKLPFHAADPLEWMHCHVAKVPPSILETMPSLPRPLADIILKLLEKDPADRYQGARGLGHDLEACLALWKSTGKIESFPLGRKDIPARLQLPQKLYGREKEIAALIFAFESTAKTGAPELVLISGYSGIGKSALVNELHRPIAGQHGIFAAGKFDQYRRDIPYATVVQAFTELMFGILAESEERIAVWKEDMVATLGPNGRLITEVIPPLELLIGVQAPVPDLSPAEAKNRFKLVFRNFIGVFSKEQHPLALFLDDLQWADSASLDLLKDLLLNSEAGHLLMIGAYRDNEVGAAHPLLSMLGEARKAGSCISYVRLGPLERPDLLRFLGDALHREPEEIQSFADLIQDKTGGNPFFTRQFLTTLYEDRLLTLNEDLGKWSPDIQGIRAKGFTDNVVGFMVGKLKRLPEATVKVLMHLACIGSEVRREVLSLALGAAVADVEAHLEEAVLVGLIRESEAGFAFAHDRVQEAAYSLIPPETLAATHLQIGRSLLSNKTEKEIEAGVFDLVNQLNPGIGLITDPEERQVLYRLNIMAGRKAKASTAYAAAQSYLAQAMALQTEDAWTTRYQDTFTATLDLSECEYLIGHFERADELFDLILGKTRSNADRARIYLLRVKLYQFSAGLEKALEVGFKGLELFGVTFPASDNGIGPALEEEIRGIITDLRGRGIAELLDSPPPTDADARAIIALISEMMGPAFSSQSHFLFLLLLKGLDFSFRYGNTPDSCAIYSGYAALRATSLNFPHSDLFRQSLYGHLPSAYEFSEMSLRLNERFDDAKWRGYLLILHGFAVNNWHKPIATSVAILEKGFAAAVNIGDLLSAGYNIPWLIWYWVETGRPLEEVRKEARKYAAFAKQSRNEMSHQVAALEQQFVAALMGLTQGPMSFDDDSFSEAECLALLDRTKYVSGNAIHAFSRQSLAFIYGRYDESLRYSLEAEGRLAEAMSSVCEVSQTFYHALTLAALYADAPAGRQSEYADTLARKLELLRLWSEGCPENFRGRHDLVAAEVARIEGRDRDAMALYDRAIRSAGENGATHIEALANESASRYYRGIGLERIADACLRDARAAYGRWGANGKVKELDRLYPQLREQWSFSQTRTTAVGTAEIDVLSVIKASQAISGEIILDRLLGRLGQVMLEYAGARKAVVLLNRDGNLEISAESSLDGEGAIQSIVLSPPTPLASASSLPGSIAKYVARTRQSVLLDDATADARFSKDEYIIERRCKSVYCLPLLRQTELVAVICLENDLVVGAFTADRQEILEVLAAQAAVSLDNARLYDDLKRENEGRRRAEERFSKVFHASPTPIAVLRLRDRVFVDVNESYLKALGYSREEVIGSTPSDLGLMDESAPHRRTPPLQKGEGIGIEEVTIRTKSGGARVMLTSVETIELAGEACALSASVDITERMQVEEQLRHSQKMDALGRMVGGIAHDFNNLLMAITGFTAMALKKIGPEQKAHEELQEVQEAGDRAFGLTRQLLAYSRKQILEPKIWDLNTIVSGVEKLLKRLIGENIRLTTSLSAEVDLIEVDRGQTEQVIMNLAVNARDAMPEGGSLSVETANVCLDEAYAATHPEVVPGGYVMLSVTDTGTGMSPEIQARIFEPFFTTKEVGKGTGLGLAVVYGIVKQSGGSIDIKSETGAGPHAGPTGTTFRIYFPQFDISKEAVRDAVEPGKPEDYRGVEAVLIVEDDAPVARFAAQSLEESGYRIFSAANGRDALKLMAVHGDAIKLVITDMIMPEMGGKELGQTLKDLFPNLPVLRTSGFPEHMETGETFLPKPFNARDLARNVRRLLDMAART